jgi:large subunit ribosomal protein L24
MSVRTKIKKGDQVQVLTGKDRGKRGKVLRVERKAGRALVEHVNMVKRHTRANPRQGVQGGIVEREAPIAISKIALVSPDSGRPSRVGYKILEDGRKVRIAKADGFTLDQ